VLFADRCKVATLKKTGGFFARLFGGAKKQPDFTSRFLVLTDRAVYSFNFAVNPETDKVETNLFARVEHAGIASVVMSKYADNFLILHFASAETKDIVLSCRRKTEFCAVLQQLHAATRVEFKNEDSVCINVQKKRNVTIKFSKDGKLGAGLERHTASKKSWTVYGSTGYDGAVAPPQSTSSGFAPPATQSYAAPAAAAVAAPRAAPAAPVAAGGGVQLKALYDCAGSTADELSFKVGDIIEMVVDEDGGWYQGRLAGKVGLVPAAYCEKLGGDGGPAPPPKPPGGGAAASPWQAITEGADTYYYNASTGESTWEKPPGMP
jgi:hypothetical protein